MCPQILKGKTKSGCGKITYGQQCRWVIKLSKISKKKKRKKENSLRSESDFSEKDNPNQKTDKKQRARGFPGGPVIKNLSYNVRDASLIAGGGTKIPHVSWQKKKKKYFFCFK